MNDNEKQCGEAANVPWAHLRLPPFPKVALRLLQLAGDENVQLHQLSDLISSDPAFASEVLTIANSLLYAPRFPATSILQAVAVLGANHLQGLCLTVGVRTYLGKALRNPAMRKIWHHNLACALIAEQLAAAGFLDKDIAFTSGILHDIGRLGLAVIKPDVYSQLLESYSGPPAGILEAEHNTFGSNHCEVGELLIKNWKLPAEFYPIVSEHHLPRQKDGPWGMAELISVSCRMADAAGYPAFLNCEITPFADLLEELPPRERREFPADVEALAEDVARKIQAVESV